MFSIFILKLNNGGGILLLSREIIVGLTAKRVKIRPAFRSLTAKDAE